MIALLPDTAWQAALEPVRVHKAYTRMHRAIVDWPELGPRNCHVKLMAPWAQPAQRCFLNEVTGYILARACGLPVPQAAGFGRVPTSALLQLHPGEPWADHAPHLAWFTATAPGDPLRDTLPNPDDPPPAAARALLEWDNLPLATAFDNWLANPDRNQGNLLRNGPGDYTLIDHDNICTSDDWLVDWLADGINDDPRNLLLNLAKACHKALSSNADARKAFGDALMASADQHLPTLPAVADTLLHWWPLLEQDSQARFVLAGFISQRAHRAPAHMANITGNLL